MDTTSEARVTFHTVQQSTAEDWKIISATTSSITSE